MTENDVLYSKKGRIATITLNRPERLNAISPTMPRLIRECVERADRDDEVHVIVIQGAGRGFCAGYDLVRFAENVTRTSTGQPVAELSPKKHTGATWDMTVDFRLMYGNTKDFMSLFHSVKPTIAKIHGVGAVAGGSDIALCCDLVVMDEKSRIGYPPSRVWGIPTTMQWIARLGPEKAKRMLFTGDLITGKEAKEMGLILDCFPGDELDARVEALANRIAAVPKNQLMMSKFVVNNAVEAQLINAQKFATIFDGHARNSPEGYWFKRRAEEVGFQKAVKERDSGEPIAPQVAMRNYSFEDMAKL